MSKKIKLEDGRQGEQIVITHVDPKTNQETVVTETWVEPKKLRLAGRTVEHYKSMVHKVEHQVIDEETGKVIDSKVEKVKHELSSGCCSSKVSLQSQVCDRITNCTEMGLGKMALWALVGAELVAIAWLFATSQGWL